MGGWQLNRELSVPARRKQVSYTRGNGTGAWNIQLCRDDRAWATSKYIAIKIHPMMSYTQHA